METSGYVKKKRESDPRKGISSYLQKLQTAGLEAPKQVATDGLSVLGKGVTGLLDVIDRPRNAIGVGIKYAKEGKNPLQGAKAGFTGKERFYGSDMIKATGDQSKVSQFGKGLLIDIATDPLTYMTFGAGGFLRGLATGSKADLSNDVLRSIKNANREDLVTRAKTELMEKYGKRANEIASGTFVDKELAAEMGEKAGKPISIHAGLEKAIQESNAQFGKSTLNDFAHRKAFLGDEFATGDLSGAITAKLGDTASDFQRAMTTKAGKGMTVFGQKLVSGSKMQELGAGANKALKQVPIANKLVDGLGATHSKFTKSFSLPTADRSLEQVMGLYSHTMKGRENFGNVSILNRTNAIRKLTDGMTDTEGKNLIDTLSSAMATPDSYAGARVIKNTPLNQDARALEALGLTSGATVGDLMNVIRKDFDKVKYAEQSAGRLGVPRITKFDEFPEEYIPRVLSKEARDDSVRRAKKGDIYNQFAKQRKEDFRGMNIEELNSKERAKYLKLNPELSKDFNLFETNLASIYAERMLASNRVLSSTETLNTALSALGKKVKGSHEGGDAAKEIREAFERGDEVVMPSHMLKNADVIDDLLQKGNMPIKPLSRQQALELSRYDRANMYILPAGFSDAYNLRSAAQLSEGMKTIKGLFDSFNSVWKPLVTAMNVKFHIRNLMSATFNNFLDLGMAAVDPSVQKMAMAVSEAGAGFGGKSTININGRTYTSKQILDLMHENNAISAFSSSDASAARGAMGEARKMAFGKNAFEKTVDVGRAVSNRTEEYVRAVNFIAHMKQGMSPMMAAEMVRTFHFDYTDLSSFEQNIKSVLPFYTWVRKNVPLQIEKFLDDPRIYQTMNRAQQEGARVNDMEQEDIPLYLRKSGAIPMGTTEDGKVRMLDMGLPSADLYFSPMKDIPSMLSPIPKGAIELGTGVNLLTGQPIQKYDEEALVDMLYNSNSPAARAAQAANRLSGGKLEEVLMQNPEIATLLSYAGKQTGALGNLNRYGTTSGEASTVSTTPSRYPADMNPALRALAGMIDPRTGTIKYLDLAKAKRGKEWGYYKDLANAIQKYKGMGETFPDGRVKSKTGYF